jgi:TP901 family phage tail tape measure protein
MAKTIKGITIEFEGRTSKLVKALGEIDVKLKNTQTALKEVNKAFELDPENMDVAISKMKTLQQAIDETKQKLALEEEAAKKASEALISGKISEADYATILSGISKTKKELEELEKQADETNKEIEDVDPKNIEEVGKQASNSKEKMLALKDAAGKVKDALVKVSKQAQNFVKSGFDSLVDYEDAFTAVKKTIEATPEQYDAIYEGIKKMATETASTKEEIAAVASTVGQMGVAADDVLDFTKTMVMLGDAADSVSATDAAMSLSKLFAVLGEDNSNIMKAGSSITDLGNKMQTTEAQIIDMATRLAATGSIVGLSTDQVLGISAALSIVGIEAEAGGSAISKLLKKIEVATKGFDKNTKTIEESGMSLRELELMQSLDTKGFKALAGSMGLTTKELGNAISGVKSLNQYAEVAGMTAQDFTQLYGTNAVAALSAFLGGLRTMDGDGQSAVTTLQEMGLTEVRLSNAILALANSDDVLTKATELSSQAWQENIALSNEADEKYSNTKSQIHQMKESYDNLKIELMEALLPVLQDLIGVVKDIVAWFSNLDEDTKENIARFVVFTATIGPLISTIGSLIGIAKTLTTVLGVAGIGGTLTSLSAVGGPIALAIAGFASLASIIKNVSDMYEGWKSMQEGKEQAERLTKAVNEAKAAQIEKMTTNPYKGLAANVNSDEYKKAVAAYKLMGLNPDDYRQRAIEIVNNQTLQLDGAVVAQSTSRHQANTNYKLNGGYA